VEKRTGSIAQGGEVEGGEAALVEERGVAKKRKKKTEEKKRKTWSIPLRGEARKTETKNSWYLRAGEETETEEKVGGKKRKEGRGGTDYLAMRRGDGEQKS